MHTFPRRIAYQKLAPGSVAVTTIGSIFVVTLTEILRIVVPSQPVPVKLMAKGTMLNNGVSGTNGDAYLGIAPAGIVGAAVAAAACVDSQGELNIGGTTTEPPGRRFAVSYWLPPNTGGDFILGAWRETGSDAVNLVANSLIPCELEAVRG